MVSLIDLARHVGLSVGTVSRALNDHPSVRRETVERVRQAAENIGYMPNLAGLSLKRGHTGVIGFLFESSRELASNADNFFLELFEGVQAKLAQSGRELVIFPYSGKAARETVVRKIISRGYVDGLIISATEPFDPRILLLKQTGFPFIALGRAEGIDAFDWIDLDFEGAAERAVTKLAGLGHRDIAVVLPESDVNFGAVFLAAFKSAIARSGLTFRPDLIFRKAGGEVQGYEVADIAMRLQTPPTAIVLVHELLAVGIYRWLEENGQQPGHDLSLIGLRDSPRSRFLHPALSCFRLDPVALGEALAERLTQQIDARANGLTIEPEARIWPFHCAEADSVGPAPARKATAD